MMKVTAFVGSARKGQTHRATGKILNKLQELGNVKTEMVVLSDYHLQICRGCKTCLDKGEEFCQLQDDRDTLIEKMNQSDGVIFATPNYSFQVSAIMKIFLDRLGFIFHRPHFFGKTYTNIVAQGIFGGNKIVKYLNFVGGGLGFNMVKGCCITTREPLTEKAEKKIEKTINKQAEKFYKRMVKKAYPAPSLLKLMLFRLSRTSMKKALDESYRDFNYYKDKGWFTSEYYYPVKLNPLKKLTGRLIDQLATKIG
jgi:multimeric flavodoxin WrbA